MIEKMKLNLQPLVSVIMPTFNQAPFIYEAITSVINQSYKNIELIIIDNFSSDNTMEIISSIHDERIKYYKLQNHDIIARSRNYGFTKASGELIAFIDSDDIWESKKLEHQIPHLQKVFLVSSNFKPIGDIQESSKYIKSNINEIYQDYDYEGVSQGNPVITSSVLMRRDVFLNTKGFDESDVFKFIEDYELWLRIAKLGIIRILSEPLVKYRIYNKKNRDETDVMIRVLKIFDKHQELGLLSTQNSMKARGNQYVCIGRAFQNIGNFKGIIYYIKGLYYSYRLKNKLRAIAGLFLFFVPKFLRIFLERIAYRMYHFFY
jgi:glycosyltransferase involved in cell wall biosynthesis